MKDKKMSLASVRSTTTIKEAGIIDCAEAGGSYL